MFVRKKPNSSGSVSVQVIDKSQRTFRVVKTLGSASDPQEIARLVAQAKLFIARRRGQYSLFPDDQRDNAAVMEFVGTLANASIRTVGPELIFGRLFDQIGFGVIPEQLFRDIVIARLVYPASKLKTVDYLQRYRGKTVSVQSIYRFLDRLNERYSPLAQEVAYRHTRKILHQVQIVFYDMTSLYFEAEDEDDLRKIGFSKDGKFQNPQIMLGLLIGQRGYPIGYDIFEGNTFEGKTLLPVLNAIAGRYGLGHPVVVADAAMLGHENLRQLEAGQYPFIIAARIHNETDALKQELLERCRGLGEGQCVEIPRENGRRLIVSYSGKRARKDAHNRRRGLASLRQRVGSGRLSKKSLNNRGYNKFLKMTGEVKVEIDEEKVQESSRWDGLKGYLTNTTLSAGEVIENYGQLWHVEKAFRISKTDLRIRPMYHRKRGRIEAHILVAFVAYTIYKELERRLAEAKIPISPQRAAELTQTMYEMTFILPNDPEPRKTLLQMDDMQQRLYGLFR